MENMRKTKLLPRKRRIREKSVYDRKLTVKERQQIIKDYEEMLKKSPELKKYGKRRMRENKPSDGWLEDKEGFRYPTRKWLNDFRKAVDQLGKNI